MGDDLRCGGSDGTVVGLQPFERLELGVAGEKAGLELVELARHVVVLVERGTRKNRDENLLGEDVLNQHLAHVGCGEAGVDGLLCVLKEGLRCSAEFLVGAMGLLDHVTQGAEHGGKIRLELLHRLPELHHRGRHVVEEQP